MEMIVEGMMSKVTKPTEIFLFNIRLWRTSSLSGCGVASVGNLVKHHVCDWWVVFGMQE
jgi:hypothetical protein